MSGPPPEATQERTDKGYTPVPGQKLKLLTPPGVVPELSSWKAEILSITT